MSSTRKHACGLTLVELMVTTSIAAVMLAIAAPSLRDFVQRSELTSATNDLSLALMYARTEAIKRGWPVTVCKSANPAASSPACSSAATWQSGWLVFVNHNGTTDTADTAVDSGTPADEIIRLRSALSATVSGGTGFGNYITFLPAGMVKGSGNSGKAESGSFTVAVGSLERLVCINTTGRSEIATGSCP